MTGVLHEDLTVFICPSLEPVEYGTRPTVLGRNKERETVSCFKPLSNFSITFYPHHQPNPKSIEEILIN